MATFLFTREGSIEKESFFVYIHLFSHINISYNNQCWQCRNLRIPNKFLDIATFLNLSNMSNRIILQFSNLCFLEIILNIVSYYCFAIIDATRISKSMAASARVNYLAPLITSKRLK